ncbi:efflux transporter outer membrane subunit [Cupriavidus sp.]|uniref:efflux transporter outer membrane subunit n=1 Tax=Cupriavidus sp. TaxID=1873897 RepID=UPI003D0B3566
MNSRPCKLPARRPFSLSMLLSTLLSIIALALGACAELRTPVENPALEVPWQWQHAPRHALAAPAAGTLGPDAWWQSFGDPQLNALVASALETNNDLAIAALRLERARLLAGLAGTNRLPEVAAEGRATRQWGLDGGGRRDQSAINATVSYEIDLWGRLASLRGAADWAARASAAELEAASITLAATTATLYWRAGLLNQLIDISDQSLADARRTLELVEARYRAGAVSGLDLAQAEQQLAALLAERTELDQERSENRQALAIVFNRPPEHGAAEPPGLPTNALPRIAPGIPAAVIGRRPDVRQAEWRLRAALADSDATRAGLYPKLTLTGLVGTSSAALASLLRDPTALLGAGLSLPFLQWEKAKLTIQVSQNEYREKVVRYRQSLYTAFAEVENALSGHASLALRDQRLAEALQAASRAERLAAVRYRAGATALQPWLDAKETRRTAAMAAARNRFDRLVNVATLYKALGGPPVEADG